MHYGISRQLPVLFFMYMVGFPQYANDKACPVNLSGLFTKENLVRVFSGSAHYSCKGSPKEKELLFFRGALLRKFPWQKIDLIRKNYEKNAEVKEVLTIKDAEFYVIENLKGKDKLYCSIIEGTKIRGEFDSLLEFCFIPAPLAGKAIQLGQNISAQYHAGKSWQGNIPEEFFTEQVFKTAAYRPISLPMGFFMVAHTAERAQIAETSGLVQGEIFYQKTRANLNTPESMKIYKNSLIHSMKKISGWDLIDGTREDCLLFKDSRENLCSYCSAKVEKNIRLVFLLVFPPQYSDTENLLSFQKEQLQKWISVRQN